MKYYSEKEFLSEMRHRHLDHAKNIWNIDIEKIKQLEKKYGHIQYMPVDVDLDEAPQSLIDDFFANCKLAHSNHRTFNNLWSGMYKRSSRDLNTTQSIQNKDSSLIDLEKKYPDYFAKLLDALPYVSLESYNIVNNNKQVPIHKDYYYFIGLPISFRCVIYNEGTPFTNGFYDYIPNGGPLEFDNIESATTEHWNDGLTGRQKQHDTGISRVYTYNNLTIKHDAVHNKGNKKMLFIPKVGNPIDWDKFEDLIEKSLKKYKNQSLLSKVSLEKYVDL